MGYSSSRTIYTNVVNYLSLDKTLCKLHDCFNKIQHINIGLTLCTISKNLKLVWIISEFPYKVEDCPVCKSRTYYIRKPENNCGHITH